MFSHDDELRIAQPWSHIHRGKSVWLEGTYSVDRQSLPDRAANAICCDRQSVSEPPATAPAVCFVIAGISMFLDDCEFSSFFAFESSGIDCGPLNTLFSRHNIFRTPNWI